MLHSVNINSSEMIYSMRRLELPIESPHTDRLALRHVNILHLVREVPARLPTEDPHDLEGRGAVNLQPLILPVAVSKLQPLLEQQPPLLLLQTEDGGGRDDVLALACNTQRQSLSHCQCRQCSHFLS